jgi:hypothetical protein
VRQGVYVSELIGLTLPVPVNVRLTSQPTMGMLAQMWYYVKSRVTWSVWISNDGQVCLRLVHRACS